MSSYTDLASAAKAATSTITSAGSTYGWPTAETAAILADVEAARASSDGWFSSSATETTAFWEALAVKSVSWNSSLPSIEKIEKWIVDETYLSESKAATAEAQSYSTMAAGTAAGSLEDVGEVVETAAQVAETAQSIAKNQIVWYIGIVAAVAFLSWRLTK